MGLVSIHKAIQKLRDSQVVALPTETVYGLAGAITDEVALKSIFTKKSRPFFDPLIVHVLDLEQAKEWAEVDAISELLIKTFWPGPLTVVLPKKRGLSDFITNGGPTVALRSPHHPLFREALAGVGCPLAAPSANLFGKTSPTTAQHVLDDFQGQIAVVDGGPCEKGIESTIIAVETVKKVIQILRPGFIDAEDLKNALNKHQQKYTIEYKKSNLAPGHLINHYQPEVPFVLIPEVHDTTLNQAMKEQLKMVSPKRWGELQLDSDPRVAARSLYSQLRAFSKSKQPIFLFYDEVKFSLPQWSGLADRIKKASSGSLIQKHEMWTLEAKS